MEAFITSIGSILSIVLLIALGYVLKEKQWFSDSFSGNISKLIMNIALPASIFVSVLKYLTLKSLLSLTGALVYTFLSVIIGYIFAYILVKILNVPVGRRGTFINTVVNANTIFIGLPLNIALFGNESLPYFLVYYVTNTVSTWAFGAILIGNDTNDKNKQGTTFDWKKLFPPPLLGFIVALVFLFLSIPVPAFVNSTLGYLGGIVTPLSLIYIGIVLHNAGLKSIKFDRDTIFALIGRFIFSPIVMLVLIKFASDILPLKELSAIEVKTFIVQSAAPALAVLPILVNEAKGDVEYATNVVTTSTLLFVIVINGEAYAILSEEEELIRKEVEDYLHEFHKKNPYKLGEKPMVLYSRLFSSYNKNTYKALLKSWEEKKRFRFGEDFIALVGYKMVKDEKYTKIANALVNDMQKAKFSFIKLSEHFWPPEEKKLLPDVIASLENKGTLVQLDGEYYTLRKLFESLKNFSLEKMEKEGEITIDALREEFGISRKNAKLFFKATDKMGITKDRGFESARSMP